MALISREKFNLYFYHICAYGKPRSHDTLTPSQLGVRNVLSTPNLLLFFPIRKPGPADPLAARWAPRWIWIDGDNINYHLRSKLRKTTIVTENFICGYHFFTTNVCEGCGHLDHLLIHPSLTMALRLSIHSFDCNRSPSIGHIVQTHTNTRILDTHTLDERSSITSIASPIGAPARSFTCPALACRRGRGSSSCAPR